MAVRRRGLGPNQGDRIREELDRISETMRDTRVQEALFGTPPAAPAEPDWLSETWKQERERLKEEYDKENQQVDRREEARRRIEALTLRELCTQCGIDPDIFKPVAVTQVPYEMRPPFVGPYQSSRLIEHRFVPEEGYRGVMVNALVNGEIPPEPSGYILVEWVKAGSNGKQSMYGPHSLSEYRAFNNEPSKGQAVVKLDNHQYGWNVEYMSWAAV